MGVNKLILIVVALGVAGLGLIYLFDPTKSFPSAELTITLKPGENVTIHIPPFNALQFAISWFTTPYYWIQVGERGLTLLNYTESLIPDEIRGLIPVTDDGKLCIFNPTGATIVTLLSGTRAPEPKELGAMKMWWYMIFGVFELIVASVIAVIKPTPTVNIRPPAKASLGQVSGQMVTDGTCSTCRGCFIWLLGGCCLRRASTGVIEMV